MNSWCPPFDAGDHNPGYIKGYLRGVRENGGQYTHAAVWAALAFSRLGDADKALELFSMLNPLNHTQTPLEVQVYKAEPYALAADVYAEGQNAGRGGWSWYTGAASWYYQAVLGGLLGFEKTGDRVRITPNLPAGWDGYTISYRYLDTPYVFHIKGNAVLEARLENDKKRHEIYNGEK